MRRWKVLYLAVLALVMAAGCETLNPLAGDEGDAWVSIQVSEDPAGVFVIEDTDPGRRIVIDRWVLRTEGPNKQVKWSENLPPGALVCTRPEWTHHASRPVGYKPVLVPVPTALRDSGGCEVGDIR